MKGPVISVVTNIGSPVGHVFFFSRDILIPIRIVFTAQKWHPYRSQNPIRRVDGIDQVCFSLVLLFLALMLPWISILTCKQWAVGSKGMIEAQYTLGGVPNILIPSSMLSGSGLCGAELKTAGDKGGKAAALNSSGHLSAIPSGLALTFILFGLLLVMQTPGFAMLS